MFSTSSFAQTLLSNEEVEEQTRHKFPHIFWKDAKEDLAGGLLIGLIIVAIGEVIGVLFAIENNTRKSAKYASYIDR